MKKLLQYIDKTYNITEKLNKINDIRDNNKSIDKNVILKQMFVGFLLRMGSLNAIFNDESFIKRMKLMFGKQVKLPGIDAARDFIERVEPDEIREINNETVQTMRRNKVFREGTIDGYVVSAFDGTELFNSKKRGCDECLERELKDGETEYFHAAVVCMSVGEHPFTIFDMEMLNPATDSEKKNEGELTGANRLLNRLYETYHHFSDIIVADELYFNAPFINNALSKKIDVVVRIKSERRLLLQDALGMINNNMLPNGYFEFKGKEVDVWDVNDFEMEGVDYPIRFLQFEEHFYVNETKYEKIDGKRKKIVKRVRKTKTIWVITTSDAPARTIWKIMHKRWCIENNGFRDLKMRYNFDHCYDHKATEVIALLIILAFNLREIYLYRRLSNFKDSKQTVKSYLNVLYDSMITEPYRWYNNKPCNNTS